MHRPIVRIVLGLTVIVLLFGVGATVKAVTSGCTLFSVDEQEFVAGNRAILDELPVFPGATKVSSDSSGFAVAADRCLAFENSGPYDSFSTEDLYTLPSKGRTLTAAPAWYEASDPRVPAVVVFFDRMLGTRGWRISHYSGPQPCYERGSSLLCVNAFVDSERYQLTVVHDTD